MVTYDRLMAPSCATDDKIGLHPPKDAKAPMTAGPCLDDWILGPVPVRIRRGLVQMFGEDSAKFRLVILLRK